MAGYIEDRWLTKRPDPATGKRRRTALYGKGLRYKVAGIPGVKARSFPDGEKAAATRWLATAQADVSRGDFYDPRSGSMELRRYVEDIWWPSHRASPTTREAMRGRIFNHILPHVGSLPLARIGHEEVRQWLTVVQRKIDVNTVIATWRHFSSIMQAAYKAKRIPANPFRDEDLKPPSRPPSKAKAWPRETVAAVRAELPERYRILVDLSVGAGLRQGEAFAVSPDDIDGDVLHVARQIVMVKGRLGFAPPKRGRERQAPATPELASAVKRHLDACPAVEVTLPWVDPTRPHLEWEDRPLRTVRLLVTTPAPGSVRGGALNRTSFNERCWRPALGAAGVIGPPREVPAGKSSRQAVYLRWNMPREDGFHVLRHTFASVVLDAGEPVTKLAEWLGHADPAFTLRTYVHFLPMAGDRGRSALSGWIG